MTQNTSSAVMQQRHEPRDSIDDFPTPPWATRALCETLMREGFPALESCWEPACGRGHMAKALGEFFQFVLATDIECYGFGRPNIDFLNNPSKLPTSGFSWIITNPPFNKAAKFAHLAIRRAEDGVALLVRTSFLETSGRYQGLFAPEPPTAVLQFVERVPMVRGRLDPKASSATSYCWIVWNKGLLSVGTRFFWIPPCRKRLERDGDYDLPAKRLCEEKA